LAEIDQKITSCEAVLRRRFEAGLELGLQFRDAQVARGLSQRELSERSGVRQADISRIERGARNPTEATLCSAWPMPLKSAWNSSDRASHPAGTARRPGTDRSAALRQAFAQVAQVSAPSAVLPRVATMAGPGFLWPRMVANWLLD
jgi:Helix-turn-helix domain